MSDGLLGLTDDEKDVADGNRHVLGNLILPTTVADIEKVFAEAKKLGALLPSGRFHADVVGITDTLDRLVTAGLAKVFSGYATHADLIKAADADPEVVQNDLAPQDTPHAPGAYFQTLTRGALWAENHAKEFDASVDHWILTKLGFKTLTGHDQGAAPVAAEPVVESTVEPVAVADPAPVEAPTSDEKAAV